MENTVWIYWYNMPLDCTGINIGNIWKCIEFFRHISTSPPESQVCEIPHDSVRYTQYLALPIGYLPVVEVTWSKCHEIFIKLIMTMNHVACYPDNAASAWVLSDIPVMVRGIHWREITEWFQMIHPRRHYLDITFPRRRINYVTENENNRANIFIQ